VLGARVMSSVSLENPRVPAGNRPWQTAGVYPLGSGAPAGEVEVSLLIPAVLPVHVPAAALGEE
jgi:hypothetical protein